LPVIFAVVYLSFSTFFDGLPLYRVTPALIPLLALPLSIVGFFDDLCDLPVSIRYLVQLITAFLLVLVSPLPLHWFALPCLLILVTAVINFVNFVDGLDGMVAGCMSIIFAALVPKFYASWGLWVLVGSLLGFLIWNWSPAKVFMGDVGSTFLGAVFAGLVLQSDSWQEASSLFLLATPLLADAGSCVIRRLLARQRVFTAHRLHLFQRLHQAGWSHSRVSFVYMIATGLLALALALGGWAWIVGLAVVELFVGKWLDQCVAVPFKLASRS